MVNLKKINNVHIIKTKYLLSHSITPFRFLGGFLIICKFDFHLWPWPFANILWWPWPFPTNEDIRTLLDKFNFKHHYIFLIVAVTLTCRMIRETETRSLIIGTKAISKNENKIFETNQHKAKWSRSYSIGYKRMIISSF